MEKISSKCLPPYGSLVSFPRALQVSDIFRTFNCLLAWYGFFWKLCFVIIIIVASLTFKFFSANFSPTALVGNRNFHFYSCYCIGILLLKNVNLQSPFFVYVEKKINAHIFLFYLDIYTAASNLSFINVYVYVRVCILLH